MEEWMKFSKQYLRLLQASETRHRVPMAFIRLSVSDTMFLSINITDKTPLKQLGLLKPWLV